VKDKGATIIQWPWHGGDNQRFLVDQQSDGSWKISAKHSNLVLDVRGGSVDKGADIIQWPWHGGGNQRFNIQPAYISGSEVDKVLKDQLKGKLASGCKIHYADATYFLTPLSEARRIIHQSFVDAQKWTQEKFDCDDFALVLKADFAIDGYKNGERRAAYCMGIVWGQLPGPHAINWIITEDLKVRFIEPQNDQIFDPRPSDKGIWFIYC